MYYTVTINYGEESHAHFGLTEKEALELQDSVFESDPHAEIILERDPPEFVEEG